MTQKNNLPAWDLSDLYKGMDDPQINADMETYKKNIKRTFKLWSKNIKAN